MDPCSRPLDTTEKASTEEYAFSISDDNREISKDEDKSVIYHKQDKDKAYLSNKHKPQKESFNQKSTLEKDQNYKKCHR